MKPPYPREIAQTRDEMVRDDEQPGSAHVELGGEGLARPVERDVIGLDATGILHEFGADDTTTNRVREHAGRHRDARPARNASIWPEEERHADVAPEFAPVAPVFGSDLEEGIARTAARLDGQNQTPQRRGAAGRPVVEGPAVVLDFFDSKYVGCFEIACNDGSQPSNLSAPLPGERFFKLKLATVSSLVLSREVARTQLGFSAPFAMGKSSPVATNSKVPSA